MFLEFSFVFTVCVLNKQVTTGRFKRNIPASYDYPGISPVQEANTRPNWTT